MVSHPITQRTQAFTLQGTSTKRPPISRGVILTKQSDDATTEAHLIYRDNERGGRITLLSCANLDAPMWKTRDLPMDSVDAGKPSIDAAQWSRFGQIHLLVEAVQQQDGNDRKSTAVPPSLISTLIWNPAER